MTAAPTTDGTSLLTMIKPDGFTRACSAAEVGTIRAAWADLLAWLQGADPDELRHVGIVAQVAQKAALRMIRYPEYDVRAWAAQAQRLRRAPASAEEPAAGPFAAVAANVLQEIGFVAAGSYQGWLNRVTIELLYADAPMFHANRERLVPLLLKGPVLIQHWQGQRRELAQAAKLVLRLALSTSGLTNLIHVESVTAIEREQVDRSLLPGAD
jgi:hypothetical protein